MYVFHGHQLLFWMRWTARLWGAALASAFIVLALVRGAPMPPDGAGFETLAQYALVGVIALGVLIGWRWPFVGGATVLLAAVALGVLATVAFRPLVSFLVFLGFLAPGVLFLLGHWRSISRWHLLGLAAAVAVVAVAGGLGARWVYDYFYGPSHPQSALTAEPVDLVEWIWSGGVTESAVVVNAKLARDTTTARIALSDSAEMRDPVYSAVMVADDDSNDRVISARFTGLRPQTRYYYAVEVDGRLDRSRQGLLHTFAGGPFSFSFAFGSCARIGSNGAVYDTIRLLEPTFFLSTGDFFYGDINVNDTARYRDEFDRTLTAPAQAALYRSLPIAYIWDDHDYGANDAGEDAPGRAAARLTYRQYVPHYPLPAGPGNAAIYQAFTVGRVRFILTDLRSERSPASAPDDENKSMLGAAQKAWFKQELSEAAGRYPLVVWVSSVPWIGAASDGGDSWAGYSTERRELADFIATSGVRGLLFLGGDAHMLAIDDGTNSDYTSNGSGGFPVMQAAALDRRGSAKGGPYSEGMYPGGGQFGLVTVTDDGGATIEVALSGRDWTGREIVAYRFTVSAGPATAGSGAR